MKLELHNADCMEIMAGYPDNYFDLAVVDPPYGIGAGEMTMGSGVHKFKKGKNWDSAIPNGAYFDELFRVSTNCVIWGGNYFTEHLPPTSHWLLWDKKNAGLSFAEGELAWVLNGKNLRIFYWCSTVFRDGGKIHPTQKPAELYKWIYANYAKPDMKILDTHLGSGSNAIAAYEMDMGEFVGCELDPDYFAAAKKRIDEALSQQKLFQ